MNREFTKNEILSRIKTDYLKKSIAAIDLKHFPVGEQSNFLLWPVFIEELEREENKRLWENVLLLQAVLASWGYTHLMVPAQRLREKAA
jgi:hypothetical protein